MEKLPENLKPRPKVYGEKAARIERIEYEDLVSELLGKFGPNFLEVKAIEPLDDKDSFGDIDLVCLPKRDIDRRYFNETIGDSLLDYKRTGHVHSLLVRLDSGKEIQVDFIQSKDKNGFKRKLMYYSKGHLSSVIGIMAKKLHFKYGTEGFFKRFKDKRGNWHDILISEDLVDGLRILGFNPRMYDGIRTLEDIAEFVSQSPFFDGSYYKFGDMLRRDRESADRNPRERYIIEKLSSKAKIRKIENEDEFFKQFFSEAYGKFQEEAERINKETYTAGNINGEKVMEVFGIFPGPTIGKILKFIGDNYPEAKELSPEIVEDIRKNFLK